MLFGLPWFAIIAIVAIGGGFIYAYKEKELEAENKVQIKAREVHDLEKLVHSLKSRIEDLENKFNDTSSRKAAGNPSSQIEINDEFEAQNPDNTQDSNSKRVNS